MTKGEAPGGGGSSGLPRGFRAALINCMNNAGFSANNGGTLVNTLDQTMRNSEMEGTE